MHLLQWVQFLHGEAYSILQKDTSFDVPTIHRLSLSHSRSFLLSFFPSFSLCFYIYRLIPYFLCAGSQNKIHITHSIHFPAQRFEPRSMLESRHRTYTYDQLVVPLLCSYWISRTYKRFDSLFFWKWLHDVNSSDETPIRFENSINAVLYHCFLLFF